ncbi:acidic mammalian chitinase-like protein [uncultured Mediterranean phage]|nr:acidic mammalian chitinase-like protein [uncultured Mediterranean phage]
MFFVWFNLLMVANAFITSWYIRGESGFTPSVFPWKYYDSVHISDPIISSNGSASCNTSDVFLQDLIHHAHKYNRKVLWGIGLNVHDALFVNTALGDNYIQTIGSAMKECNIDGIESDYEWQDTKWGKIGIVTPEQSTRYTAFLGEIKKATGGIVAADVSIWGIKKGLYPLGVLPWVNASMLNAGVIDYINTMSYHWSEDGNLGAWKKDAFFLHEIWGMDKTRVNIGIPYYSKGALWNKLEQLCSNIEPEKNVCNGTVFVGKQMNYEIGKWLGEEGWKGSFPWAATYDSLNQSLVKWLYNGFEKK